MPTAVSRDVLAWLRHESHPPVSASWVPGATQSELRALNGLGGIARELMIRSGWKPNDPTIKKWFSDAPSVPESVLEEIEGALAEDRDVALATLYSELVRSDHRRQLGTFFTPSAEAEFMITRWNETHGTPQTVVDVGAGVGVFTAAAMNAWPESHVVAVDVNPVTLGLLGVRLYGAPDASTANRSELVLDDFTTWIENDSFHTSPSPRLILGNPPYTRASLMSVDERHRLHESTGGVCGLRASLSTLITALTLRNLSPTDGLCLLLPAQWLESDYAVGLRRLIWSSSRRVELRLVESALFDDAQVDAVVLMVGPDVDAATKPEFVVASWRENEVATLERSEECPENWRKMFVANPMHADVTSNTQTVKLGDIANVRRGLATGANSFFVLTDAERTGANLEDENLLPTVTRLRTLPDKLYKKDWNSATRNARRWLVTATEQTRKDSYSLNSYLQVGESQGVDTGYLCAKRGTWYDLTLDMSSPDVIIGAMTRSSFRVIENRMKAVITNNLYGWTWKSVVNPVERERVLEWFRSSPASPTLTPSTHQL